MILYGCPVTGTVSLSVSSLVRLPYVLESPCIIRIWMHKIVWLNLKNQTNLETHTVTCYVLIHLYIHFDYS